MEIDFEAAARIDDLLCVETAVVEGSGARLVLSQSVTRGDRVLTRARVVVAAVRIGGGATRLPKALLERLRS